MNLRQVAHKLCQVVTSLNVLLLLPLIMFSLGHYSNAFIITFGIVTLLSACLMGGSAWLAIKGQSSAQIFFAGWLVLISSVMVYISQLMGLLPALPYASVAINVGSLIEFLILAVAVTMYFNQSQQNSIAYHTEQAEKNTKRNQQLEIIVQERTALLDEAHNKLADIAMTDPLTGLLNRHHFSKQLEHQLSQTTVAGEILTLILLDIDNFKAYNDRHGHSAGDQALCLFAKVLKEAFAEESEEVFRIGGEEFAVLLRTDSKTKIQSKLAAFKIHSEQGNMPFPDQSGNKLSYSVGVALVSSSDTMPTPSGLFSLADGALYTAKSKFHSEPVLYECKSNFTPLKGQLA